jgi:hypothetical protein
MTNLGRRGLLVATVSAAVGAVVGAHRGERLVPGNRGARMVFVTVYERCRPTLQCIGSGKRLFLETIRNVSAYSRPAREGELAGSQSFLRFSSEWGPAESAMWSIERKRNGFNGRAALAAVDAHGPWPRRVDSSGATSLG